MKTFGPDEDSKDCDGNPFEEEEEALSEAAADHTHEDITESTAVCNKRKNKANAKLNPMIVQNLIAHQSQGNINVKGDDLSDSLRKSIVVTTSN